MRKCLSALNLLCFLLASVGCDEPVRPRRPATEAEETVEELRDRRRGGVESSEDQFGRAEDRYGFEDRSQDRRRPNVDRGASAAAEAAEDDRDAEADRPTSAKD